MISIAYEYDKVGATRWFLEASFKIRGEEEISERFSITEADQSLRNASWLREFALLSNKDRRQQYNNLFENYFLEKKRKKRT
jgi:hypothetical protein